MDARVKPGHDGVLVALPCPKGEMAGTSPAIHDFLFLQCS
jgi:hypothetical protein